jgi:hypothetical protein
MPKCKTITLVSLILLLLAQTVFSLPLCDDLPVINQNCTFVTPTISCTVNSYDILNVSGFPVIDNQALTQINGSIFKFDFNLTNETNNFVVRLCDGTTREIFVEGDDVSYAGGVAILFIAGIGVLAFYGFLINTQQILQGRRITESLLVGLKSLYLLSFPWLGLLGIHLARVIAQNAAADQSVINALNTAFTVIMWINVFSLIIIGLLAGKKLFELFESLGSHPALKRGKRT